MNKVMTAREAIDLIQDNMTFAFTGFVSFGLPEDLRHQVVVKRMGAITWHIGD